MLATYRLTNSNWGEVNYLVRGLKRIGFHSLPARPAHTKDREDVFVYHMYRTDREVFLTFNARSSIPETCNLYLRGAYDDGFDRTLKSILEKRAMKIELISRE